MKIILEPMVKKNAKKGSPTIEKRAKSEKKP